MASPEASNVEIHGQSQVNRVRDERYRLRLCNRSKVRPGVRDNIHVGSRRRGENVTNTGGIRQNHQNLTRYSDWPSERTSVPGLPLSSSPSATTVSVAKYAHRIPVRGKHASVRNTYQRIKHRFSHLRHPPIECRRVRGRKNYGHYSQHRLRKHDMKLETTNTLATDGTDENGEQFVTRIQLTGRHDKPPGYRDEQKALYGAYLSGQLPTRVKGNPVYCDHRHNDAFPGGYRKKYHTLDPRQAKHEDIHIDMRNWRSPELAGSKSKSTPELTSSDQLDSGISSDGTLRDYQQTGKLRTSLIVKSNLPGNTHSVIRNDNHRPMGGKVLSLSAENLLNLQRYQAHVDKRRCEHEIERLERQLTAIGARIQTHCGPYAIPPLRAGRFPSFMPDRRKHGSDMSCELGTESDDRDTGISNSSADDESSVQGKKDKCFSVTAELERFMRKSEPTVTPTAWPGEGGLGVNPTEDLDPDPLYATIPFNTQSNITKQSSEIQRPNGDVINRHNGITVKDMSSRTHVLPNQRTLVHTTSFSGDSPYISISDMSQPEVHDLTSSRVPLAWQKSVSFSADTLDNENKTKRYQKEKLPGNMERSAIFIEEDETSDGSTFFVRNGSITKTSMTDDEKVPTYHVKPGSSARANGHLIIQENGGVVQKMDHDPEVDAGRTRKILLWTLVIVIVLAIFAVAISLGVYFGTRND